VREGDAEMLRLYYIVEKFEDLVGGALDGRVGRIVPDVGVVVIAHHSDTAGRRGDDVVVAGEGADEMLRQRYHLFMRSTVGKRLPTTRLPLRVHYLVSETLQQGHRRHRHAGEKVVDVAGDEEGNAGFGHGVSCRFEWKYYTTSR